MGDGNDQELNIRINSTVNGDGLDQTSKGLRDIDSASTDAAGGANALGKNISSTRSELREFSMAGRESREIVDGLSQGGFGGLTMAMRGVTMAARTLVGVFGVSAKIAFAALSVVLAAAVALFSALKGKVDQAAESLKKAGSDSEFFKQEIAKAGEEFKKSFDIQEKEMEKIHELYDNAKQDLDESSKRTLQLIDANKKLADSYIDLQRQNALSKSGSPEEAEAINKKFDLAKQANDEKSKEAELTERAAQAAKQEQSAKEQIAKIDVEIAKASALEADAIEKSETVTRKSLAEFQDFQASSDPLRRRGDTERAAEAMVTDTSTARARAEVEKKQQDENIKKLTEQKRAAQKDLGDAVQEKSIVGIEGKTATNENAAEVEKITDKKPASQVSNEATNSSASDAIAAKISELKDQQMRTLDQGEEARIQQEIDALEKQDDAIKAAGDTGAKEFIKASQDIEKAANQLPQSLDPQPLADSFTKYHTKNLERHKKNEEAITKLSAQVDTLAGQIANSR